MSFRKRSLTKPNIGATRKKSEASAVSVSEKEEKVSNDKGMFSFTLIYWNL